MSKNKNTKMFLAGTMALSSVVAVGLPAGTADAAVMTKEELAAKAEAKYLSLELEERVALSIGQKHIADNIGLFISAEYLGKGLKTPLQNLLLPLTNDAKQEFEEGEITTEVLARIAAFRSAAKAADSDLTDAQIDDLIIFAEEMRDELSTSIESTKLSNLLPLYTAALSKFNDSKAPTIIKDVFEMPTDNLAVLNIINTIQAEVDLAIENLEEDTELPPVETTPGVGSGGGGATPPPTEPPTTTPGGGITTSPDTLEKNPQDVIDAINKAETVKELAVEATPGEAVTIPMTVTAALENKNADAVVVIASTEASYELPVSVIDGAALAKQLGVASSELNITVELTKIANQLPKEDSIGFAIEFSIKATAPNGKSVDITYLGYPVLRSIETPTALNAATSVGVRVNKDGSFTAVPTYIDGKTANLYFSANSAYTVIQNDKTFKDVDARGFWAESYIEKLASKMIINGKTSTVFAPDHSVTRGEFAALLSRGLGLVAENKNSTDFTDVAPTQAINKNGEISAVVEAGIVEGYGNGKFKPSNPITRSEAAIMISKAMDYIDSEDITFDKTQKVSAFKDYRYISATGRPHIEKVLQADYLDGFKDNTFRSENKTTRAEASKILYNFFNSIKFIN